MLIYMKEKVPLADVLSLFVICMYLRKNIVQNRHKAEDIQARLSLSSLYHRGNACLGEVATQSCPSLRRKSCLCCHHETLVLDDTSGLYWASVPLYRCLHVLDYSSLCTVKF